MSDSIDDQISEASEGAEMSKKEEPFDIGKTPPPETHLQPEREHLHIAGLSDLWLAWAKPNKLAARAVTEALQEYLTPGKAVGAVQGSARKGVASGSK